MKRPAFMNWSGGKDSALSLYRVLTRDEFDVRYLFTVVNEAYGRISIHGVREELLDTQAAAIGIPLVKCYLTESPSMEEYEQAMSDALAQFAGEGITAAIFGDIFLEDLRRYREEKLAAAGFTPVFPLWGMNTKKCVEEFINDGFRAVVTSVDARYLDESFTGRWIDTDFIQSLPESVDPCGENGEFHSFVIDGPIFKMPVTFSIGEKVLKKYKNKSENDDSSAIKTGFWYCDLLPE
jgi:uncharacterized protein (TIGR00290 family)